MTPVGEKQPLTFYRIIDSQYVAYPSELAAWDSSEPPISVGSLGWIEEALPQGL